MKREVLRRFSKVVLTSATLTALVVVASVALVGCATGSGRSGRGPTGSTPGSSAFTPGGESPVARSTLGIAYFATSQGKIVPVRVDAAKDDRSAVVKALFSGLTEEAKRAGYSTAIPVGTALRSLSIETSTAVVDVSSEFGSEGGSQSTQMRVAQLVFTLTRDPAITKVEIKMEGKPVAAFGGAGLDLTKPQTRADWEDLSPAILIESPVLDDTVSGEFIVYGTADVFEAAFRLEMQSPDGSVRTTHKITAASGTGTRGSFEASETAAYSPAGRGYLVGLYISAKDMKRVVSMKVPLTIK